MNKIRANKTSKNKSEALLQINNLVVEIENKKILNGLNIEVPAGQTHVIMGPNGSGKSTLAKIIMGSPDAKIKQGEIRFRSKVGSKIGSTVGNKKINDMSPDERAKLGIFLANQYPVEIPGVNLANFLRIAYNSRFEDKKKHLSPFKFKSLLEEKLKLIGLPSEFAQRNLNQGFSGGEKKKCEILQLAVLEPKLAILDETDSGLDIDALKQVFTAVQKIKDQQKDMSLLIITHYERIFNYIKPDKIHILQQGKIVETGNKKLLEKIHTQGFKNT